MMNLQMNCQRHSKEQFTTELSTDASARIIKMKESKQTLNHQ